MELLVMFSIYMGWMFIAGVIGLIGLGILLLCDYVFNTHVGRRACRWIMDK